MKLTVVKNLKQITFRVFESILRGGGGLLESGAYFIFSLKRGTYLRGGAK